MLLLFRCLLYTYLWFGSSWHRFLSTIKTSKRKPPKSAIFLKITHIYFYIVTHTHITGTGTAGTARAVRYIHSSRNLFPNEFNDPGCALFLNNIFFNKYGRKKTIRYLLRLQRSKGVKLKRKNTVIILENTRENTNRPTCPRMYTPIKTLDDSEFRIGYISNLYLHFTCNIVTKNHQLPFLHFFSKRWLLYHCLEGINRERTVLIPNGKIFENFRWAIGNISLIYILH